MRKIQRLAAIGAAAALTVALGACGAEEEPATDAPAEPTAAAPMTEDMDMGDETTDAAAGDGVTEIADIFGPACDQVPAEGPGSADDMIDDPVATAASNNPLLTTLVEAVTAADLGDTLNSAEALTVLAPFDGAFEDVQEALGEEEFMALLEDTEALTNILTLHVSDTRYDAEGIVEAGEMAALNGESVMVAGDAMAPTFQGPGSDAPATTLCGNIPTANATVFVIDAVLMPSA